jgi:hypothetical protein
MLIYSFDVPMKKTLLLLVGQSSPHMVANILAASITFQ